MFPPTALQALDLTGKGRNRPSFSTLRNSDKSKQIQLKDKDAQGVMEEVSTGKKEGDDRTPCISIAHKQSFSTHLLPLRVGSIAFSKVLL